MDLPLAFINDDGPKPKLGAKRRSKAQGSRGVHVPSAKFPVSARMPSSHHQPQLAPPLLMAHQIMVEGGDEDNDPLLSSTRLHSPPPLPSMLLPTNPMANDDGKVARLKFICNFPIWHWQTTKILGHHLGVYFPWHLPVLACHLVELNF